MLSWPSSTELQGFPGQVYLAALFKANLIFVLVTKQNWVHLRVRNVCASAWARSGRHLPMSRHCACALPSEAALRRVAQAQCPPAKMAARCSTRWLLVAVGTPRLPAAAERGARPPRVGVVGVSLGRTLSVTAFTPSLGARGRGALLTLRPCVSLTGESRLQRLNRTFRAWKGVTLVAPAREGSWGVFRKVYGINWGRRAGRRQKGLSSYSEAASEGELHGDPLAGVKRPIGREPSPLYQHFWRHLSALPLLPSRIPFSSVHLIACRGREEVTVIGWAPAVTLGTLCLISFDGNNSRARWELSSPF